MTDLLIFVIALLLDLVLAEPPNRFHPVAWLGKFISFQLKFAPGHGRVRQFMYGLGMVVVTAALIIVPVAILSIYLHKFNTVIYVLFSAYVLKNTFSLRGLWKAVNEVKISLSLNNVTNARSEVRALVHRDAALLSELQLMSAAIESCAENLCDSFVAPLFYYAIFGLPGAVAYRIVNTFDAMIGYHGDWEYTGKFAARLDDIVNYIPARLSALLIVVAAAISRNDVKNAWNTMVGAHSKTESPNAGWTMGAMAGALGVQLEKAGYYILGTDEKELSIAAISRSQNIMLMSAVIWSSLVVAREVISIAAG